MNIRSLHLRVARKTLEALDICTFELVDVDGGALPSLPVRTLMCNCPMV